MRALNADASRAALALGVRCATDVTGFALLGHASHVARASGVTLVIHPARVPTLPGARAAWRDGQRTGGAERNLAYLRDRVEWNDATEEDRAILLDPQTSGGLLVAMPVEQVAEYVGRVSGAVEIGEVRAAGAKPIVLA
jgi:selenide,water dikinase